MGMPEYRVQVLDFVSNTDYSIGSLLAEFDRPHAIGYGDYLNSVPEAFFSLHQDDPKITALRNKGGRAHVRIRRDGDLVWTGWVALERDANSDDAIFYCYGYLAGLYWSLTDWQQTWASSTLGTIVSDMWTRAKTTLTKSRLAFVATGTIQSPPTTAGGGTPITLPVYEAYRKRILYVVQEMAAIAGSDTGNSTAFKISHSTTPTFSFLTDVADATDVRWEWGDSRVQSFREYGMPVYHRNAIYAIGQQPRDLVLRHNEIDGTNMDAGWGRMEEPLFLAWVKDQTELERVTKQRAAWAKREEIGLTLNLKAGSEPPPGASDARFDLGDIARVKIDRGVTNIDKDQQISGYMVAVLNGQEKMNVLVQDPV